MGKKKFRPNLYQAALLYKNYDVPSISIYFLYAPHIYSQIKTKPSAYIYKMWTSQFVHILGAWSYPYYQTNQTSTYSEHLLFILVINPSATKLSDVFE